MDQGSEREEREAESREERRQDQGEPDDGHLGGAVGFARIVYTNWEQVASEDVWMGERVGEAKAKSGPPVRSIAVNRICGSQGRV